MKKQFKWITGSSILAVLFLAVLGSNTQNTSIWTEGTITLTPKADEVFTRAYMHNYMDTAKPPKIILRVPASVEKIVTENKYSGDKMYATIEKEFAKAGFQVRDRALYEIVLNRNNTPDYPKIKEATGTDLILEFTNWETVDFNTNRYRDIKGKDKLSNVNLVIPGYKIDFRIIFVGFNDIGGTYTFYYTPCTYGCQYRWDNFGKMFRNESFNKSEEGYEYTNESEVQNFFKTSAQRLLKELK
jgi:hypothetical protein